MGLCTEPYSLANSPTVINLPCCLWHSTNRVLSNEWVCWNTGREKPPVFETRNYSLHSLKSRYFEPTIVHLWVTPFFLVVCNVQNTTNSQHLKNCRKERIRPVARMRLSLPRLLRVHFSYYFYYYWNNHSALFRYASKIWEQQRITSNFFQSKTRSHSRRGIGYQWNQRKNCRNVIFSAN